VEQAARAALAGHRRSVCSDERRGALKEIDISKRVRYILIIAIALLAVASFAVDRFLGLGGLTTGHAGGGGTPTLVPVELALLVDVSGSVDDSEYQLQKRGYERAFRSDALQADIIDSGGIAVIYIEWSKATHQRVMIDWTLLSTAAECDAYADRIATITRSGSNQSTHLAPALEFAAAKFQSNDYNGIKKVIDVSGDGPCKNYLYYLDNTGYNSEFGRPWNDVISDIAPKVSQINGICIGNDPETIAFYRDILPQGNSAFSKHASDFNAFGAGILEKLQREIGSIPGMYD
jgi:hypothetical protein